jgi:alpha-1,3-mannosyltransferase
MRIVHVVRQFYPAVGGLETVVQELASAQVADGHAVRVVTLNRIFECKQIEYLLPQETFAGVQVIRIPYFGSTRYPIAWSVIKYIGDADIVHVHGVDFFFDYLAWTKPIHGRILIVTTHGGFFHTPFAAPLKRIYFSTITRLSIKSYAGVAAVSEMDRLLFAKIRHRGLICIENGVNVEKYRDASAQIPTKAIICVGRLSSNKRLDRLMTFFAALRRRDPQWLLKIVGRPYDIDAGKLQTSAESLGIGDAITIIESAPPDKIRDLMRDCSVFVSASDYEGFGIAAVEAMSAGLFPVLSNIPPHRFLRDRTGLGLLVNFQDAEAAATQFMEEWSNFNSTYMETRSNLIKACSDYDWYRITQTYQSFYELAIGKKIRTIIDIPIRVATFSEARAFLDITFAKGGSAVVAIANAHTLYMASSDALFREALLGSIIFNDGVGVDIASRLLFRNPFPENLNGTDFIPNYLRQSINRYRIFLLGARPSIVVKAAETLAKIAPQHEIVGCRDGYFQAHEIPKIIEEIRHSKSDILLVAMGNPKQELWLKDYFAATGCGLGFGVGALFDFLAEQVPRAPARMRSLRLEWVFRIIQEPRRLWHRYLVGSSAFLMKVAGQWWSGSRV